MLARGAGVRPAVAPPTPSEGPSADELEVPPDVIAASTAVELVKLVQRVQEARLAVTERFQSRFEDLVTAGQAADYKGLVDRFRPRYAAVDDSLERIAVALSPAHGMLASLVRGIIKREAARLDLALEEQVLRQNLSLLGPDEPDRPELKGRVGALQKKLAETEGAIHEGLEELRCEAADIEDE